MRVEAVLILILVVFYIGFVAGARTFHPAYLIEYVPTWKSMNDCLNKGGKYFMQNGNEICQEKTNYACPAGNIIFSHTLNNAYFNNEKN